MSTWISDSLFFFILNYWVIHSGMPGISDLFTNVFFNICALRHFFLNFSSVIWICQMELFVKLFYFNFSIAHLKCSSIVRKIHTHFFSQNTSEASPFKHKKFFHPYVCLKITSAKIIRPHWNLAQFFTSNKKLAALVYVYIVPVPHMQGSPKDY